MLHSLFWGTVETVLHLSATPAMWLSVTDRLVLTTHIYETPITSFVISRELPLLALSLIIALRSRMTPWRSAFLIVAGQLGALLISALTLALRLTSPLNQNTLPAPMSWFLETPSAGMLLILLLGLRLTRGQKRSLLPGNDRVQNIRPMDSPLPGLWRFFYHQRFLLTLALLVCTTALTVRTLRTDSRRAGQYVNLGLALERSAQMQGAEAAYDAAILLLPHSSMLAVERLRFLIRAGHHETARRAASRLTPGTHLDPNELRILRAETLQIDGIPTEECIQRIATYPEALQQHPRIALLKATHALEHYLVQTLEVELRRAAADNGLAPRIRSFFPALARLGRWQLIADIDRFRPVAEAESTLASIQAHMRVRRPDIAAEMTRKAIKHWPDDPRYLPVLFYLNSQLPDGDWESLYATHLLRASDQLKTMASMYTALMDSRRLHRADLCTLLIRRMQIADPTHPLTSLARQQLAQDGQWIQASILGLPATSSDGHINLAHVTRFAAGVAPIQHLLESGFRAYTSPSENHTSLLERCKNYRGKLTPEDYLVLTRALIEAGESEQATVLVRLAGGEPDFRPDQLNLLTAEIAASENDWDQVHSILHDYDPPYPDADAMLLRIDAASHLNLWMIADGMCRETSTHFPASTRLAARKAMIQLAHRNPELALHTLARTRDTRSISVATMNLLYLTGRLAAAKELNENLLLPVIPDLADTKAPMFAPEPLTALNWASRTLPSPEALRDHAEQLKGHDSSDRFLKSMHTLWLEAYERETLGNSADPARWAAAGRTGLEKAHALYQLAVLLCWQERYLEARDVLGDAIGLYPTLPQLHYLLVSLSGVESPAFAEARSQFPDDPLLLLAGIEDAPATAISQSALASAVESAKLPGAYLAHALQHMSNDESATHAVVAAGTALSRQPYQYLPLAIAALNVAVTTGDSELGMLAARQAMQAIKPDERICQNLIAFAHRSKQTDDPVVLDAYRRLSAVSETAKWRRGLGFEQFLRGGRDLIMANVHLHTALERGDTRRITYIYAAEAARRVGAMDQAVNTLRKGLAQYPDDLLLRNNLACTLALMAKVSDEAMAMVATLIRDSRDRVEILSTAALVYFQSGDLERARTVCRRILDHPDATLTQTTHAQTRLAWIAFEEGDTKQAYGLLARALDNSRALPDEYIVDVDFLRQQIEEQLEREAQTDPENPPRGIPVLSR